MSVSHELRTPLTTIKGYAEALADGVVGADGAQRAGQTMLAESEHLDRLVEDLLVLARLEADDFPLEVMPVELVALVANAAESWAARCAAVGVRAADRAARPRRSSCAPTRARIRQVVDGLLENALRVRARRGGAPGRSARGRVPPSHVALTAGVRVDRRGDRGARRRARASPTTTWRWRSSGARCTSGTRASARSAAAWVWPWPHRLVRRLGGRIEAGHAAEGGARFTVRLPR